MRTVWMGWALCRRGVIRYELLSEHQSGRCAYGVRVCFRNQRSELRALTVSRQKALLLLRAMRRGRVTPVTAPDVAEDWIAAGNA